MERKKQLETWAKRKNKQCPVIILSDYVAAPCSIENLLEPTLHTEAVIAASQHLIEDGTIPTPQSDWQTKLKQLLATADNHRSGSVRRTRPKRSSATRLAMCSSPSNTQNLSRTRRSKGQQRRS